MKRHIEANLDYTGKHGSVIVRKRVAVFSAEEILPRIGTPELGLSLGIVRQDEWHDDRLLCFKHHGVVCIECGLIGSFFALEQVESDHYTGLMLNLYGEGNILFTKDHIVPKKLGGPNSLENYQTMCWPCNQAKGCSLFLHRNDRIIDTLGTDDHRPSAQELNQNLI